MLGPQPVVERAPAVSAFEIQIVRAHGHVIRGRGRRGRVRSPRPSRRAASGGGGSLLTCRFRRLRYRLGHSWLCIQQEASQVLARPATEARSGITAPLDRIAILANSRSLHNCRLAGPLRRLCRIKGIGPRPGSSAQGGRDDEGIGQATKSLLPGSSSWST